MTTFLAVLVALGVVAVAAGVSTSGLVCLVRGHDARVQVWTLGRPENYRVRCHRCRKILR